MEWWNSGNFRRLLEYYKIVAHKDYTGVRFDDDMRNVVTCHSELVDINVSGVKERIAYQ